ncbi:MAG: hypothetical protein SGPRY_011965, partial [Prymnesium sp.]
VLGGLAVPRHVVLITRESVSTSAASAPLSRRFTNSSLIARRLQASLSGEFLPLYLCLDPLKSERATLELFGGAAGVVGYHGAGLVNSVFIPHAACVVEISTFLSTQRENSSIPWRANEHRRTLAWSPAMLNWRYHRLSLDQILTANRVEIPRDANDLRRPTTRQRRNDFIKTLPLVPLSDADVISIGRLLRSCMIRKK